MAEWVCISNQNHDCNCWQSHNLNLQHKLLVQKDCDVTECDKPKLVKQRVEESPATLYSVAEVFINEATSLLVSIFIQRFETCDKEVGYGSDLHNADD